MSGKNKKDGQNHKKLRNIIEKRSKYPKNENFIGGSEQLQKNTFILFAKCVDKNDLVGTYWTSGIGNVVFLE